MQRYGPGQDQTIPAGNTLDVSAVQIVPAVVVIRVVGGNAHQVPQVADGYPVVFPDRAVHLVQRVVRIAPIFKTNGNRKRSKL